MIFEIGDIVVLFFVFIRTGAFFMAIPILSGDLIPGRYRIALAFLVAAMIDDFAVVNFTMGGHFVGIMLMAVNEVLIGLYMAFAVRLVFYILEFAGHVISTSIGLMTSQSLNPLSGVSSTAVGSVLYYFGLLVFFIIGAHHKVLLAYSKSFEILPIGQSLLIVQTMDEFVKHTSTIFTVGTLIAAPFIALNFLINFTFAVLGKAAPKMNVFITSFAVRILAGLTMLASSAALIASYVIQQADRSPMRLLNLIVH